MPPLNVRTLRTLWRTVAPLRPEQIWGRLAFLFRQRLLWPVFQPTTPATNATISLRADVAAGDEAARSRGAAILSSGCAMYAGHLVGIDAWNDSALAKLVRYHLHYLDAVRDLVACSRPQPAALPAAVALARRWFNENPFLRSEGWEPYPVAARLQNLSVLAATLGRDSPEWLAPLLATHCRYLERWPETHLQANHLLKDWLALALGALVLDGGDAPRWLDRGLRETQVQLEEQILPDGGHYERSPMYHALILSDLLDLQELARVRQLSLPWLDEGIAKMAGFLRAVLHPDGEIPLFNDAVIGQAPAAEWILKRAGRTSPPPTSAVADAPDFGLTAVRPSADELLLFDSGALGPAYQPGHAHSDTLSYELSIGGERRVVNAGMDGYQSQNRPFFRSAAAHNTVTVNGEGPDELWASFRVGGRNQVTSRSHRAIEGRYELSGSLRAFQRWTQHRTIALFPGKLLVVIDDVVVPKGGEVVSRARVAPGTSPLQFRALLGEHQSGKTRYAPHFGEVREIDEHRVHGSGKRVRLAYALICGGGEIQVRAVESSGGVEVIVDLDGTRHHVRVGPG